MSRGCRSRSKPTGRPEQVDMSEPSQSQHSSNVYELVIDSIQRQSSGKIGNKHTRQEKGSCVWQSPLSKKKYTAAELYCKEIHHHLLTGWSKDHITVGGSKIFSMLPLEVYLRSRGLLHTLDGRAVNQIPIPFSGWVEVELKLSTEEVTQMELLVPVLVAQENGVAEEAITGFNEI